MHSRKFALVAYLRRLRAAFPLAVDSGEEGTSALRLRQQQQQEAADHELALQTAMRMESGVDTDLQNLISGNFLPTTSKTNLANSQAAVTNRVFRHADVIEKELKTIADSLRSEKVANVVRVIPRAVLFQYLTRYEEQQAGNTSKLGIFLTSRPVEEVLEHGIAAEHKYSCTPILPMDTAMNASSGQARLDPSRQIGVLGKSRNSKVPEFVWLVLYMHPTQAMIVRRSLSKTDRDSTHAVRDREEEIWTKVPGLIPDACNRHDVVIPLLCTANANFRRPNNRVLQRPLTSRVSIGDNDDDKNQIYSDRYWTAYQRFSNTILAEMLQEQHVGLPQYLRPSETSNE